MSMNFLDAAGVLADSAELPLRDLLAHEAKSIVQATVAAYDALAPDWADAPERAQWYTIDADGIPRWHVENPSRIVACDKILIPLGVDWRLCKWQRPEVAA